MEIGGRSLERVIAAVFEGGHYTALANSFLVYRSPFSVLSRYVLRTGGYPATVAVERRSGRSAFASSVRTTC